MSQCQWHEEEDEKIQCKTKRVIQDMASFFEAVWSRFTVSQFFGVYYKEQQNV